MLTAIAKAPTLRTLHFIHLGRLMPFLFCVWLIVLFVFPTGTIAAGKQSKEQCKRCCEKQYEGDQFSIDQCKLKCFRNTDHCILEKSSAPEARVEEDQEKKKKPAKKKKQRKKRRRTKTITLKWPDPLNLMPQQEVVAAAQILEINGLSMQNPNYGQALYEVTAILIQFRVDNPQGGDLPTEALKNVLIKYL